MRTTVRAFLSGVAGGLLVLVVAAVTIPLYGDYSARAGAADILISLQPVQARVAAQAIARESVSGSGVGISLAAAPIIKEMTVLPDGIIIAVGMRHGQVFVLLPSYSAGSVTWRCIAGSAKDVPRHCRE